MVEEERLTEDLLARLLATSELQTYLDEDVTLDRALPGYLKELLDARGMKRTRLATSAGINATVVHDIFNGKIKRPGRDKLIMLAFGMRCSLRETQRMLRLADASELWPKVRRDAIIAWCIDRGLTREACDDELWRFGERTLFGTGQLNNSVAH